MTTFLLLITITLSSGQYVRHSGEFASDAACQKERTKLWKSFEKKELKELLAANESFGVEVECYLQHTVKPSSPS
jgi:hypothetical protein